MDVEKIARYGCSIEAFMGVLGGKYKAIIAYELIGRPLRYSEIARLVPKATPRMLSRQLKEMEADGIVHREQYPVMPPKVEYSLTELGETLVPMITEMCAWGERYFELAGLPSPCDGVNPFAQEYSPRIQPDTKNGRIKGLSEPKMSRKSRDAHSARTASHCIRAARERSEAGLRRGAHAGRLQAQRQQVVRI